MDRFPFDFDVVTGPPAPREESKEKPREDDGGAPEAEVPAK